MNDPSEAELEAKGVTEAAKYGPRILKEHADELRSLVTTYSDADAQTLLISMRDWFWGEALPAAVAKGKKV